MPSRLLAVLESEHLCQGLARTAGEAETTKWSFNSAADFAQQAAQLGSFTLYVSSSDTESPAVYSLLGVWDSDQRPVIQTADAAYLFCLPEPRSLDELDGFAEQVEQRLAELPADLLAQLVELAGECGAQARLGFLAAELQRRFDVFSMPAAGEVEVGRYFAPLREPGENSRQVLAPDLLERLLSAHDALAAAFDSYEERPQQLDMARAVATALTEGRQIVVEAGTGVGKSLAYLLPLAIHAAQSGKLCLVSTNTLNLQQQLMELDIPRVRRILDMLELKVALLKGREHYLCIKRLEDGWLKAGAQARQRRERLLEGVPDALFMLRLLLDFAADPHGDLDALPSPAGLHTAQRSRILASLDCRFKTCLGDRCPRRRPCHFFARRAEALTSHIVVTNHALVFSLHDPSDSEADNIVSRAGAIVFDEAHNLEQVITSQNTLEVTNLMPVDLGNRLLSVLQHEGCSRRLVLPPHSVEDELRPVFAQAQGWAAEVPNWIRLGASIREQVDKLLAQAAGRGHLPSAEEIQLTPSTATPQQAQVLELLGKLAARLGAVINRYRDLATALALLFADESNDLYLDDTEFQMELHALGSDLADCHLALARWQPEEPQTITWFNAEGMGEDAGWEFKTAPLDVGPVFQSLIAGKDSVVLCSATLTVAERFDFLQGSLGYTDERIGQADWLKLDSPFNYAEQSLLLLANDVVTPTGATRERYLEQLEEIVAGVCGIFPRGVLVLFNSYRDLNHTALHLPYRIDARRLLIQGVSGSRQEIAEQFRREGDRVLLATRSFWEGFDVAGEALSCVVLAKLPFANFKDPIHAGRERAIKAEGGDAFRQLSLPLAAMQLKQGFGRLIRTTRDYGCVFLLDSRVVHANYGKVFLDSLPGPRKFAGRYADCLEEAARFMRKRSIESVAQAPVLAVGARLASPTLTPGSTSVAPTPDTAADSQAATLAPPAEGRAAKSQSKAPKPRPALPKIDERQVAAALAYPKPSKRKPQPNPPQQAKPRRAGKIPDEIAAPPDGVAVLDNMDAPAGDADE